MPNNNTITAADAVLLLSVAGLFDTPIRIQGFSTDDITSAESVNSIETMMGVDGRLSGGYVPVPTTQGFTLQADSQSNQFFETVFQTQQQSRSTMIFTGTLLLPAIQRQYQMTRGFLQGYKPFPDVKKVLQPRAFAIIWERVTSAPL